MNNITRWMAGDGGASMVEYSLLVALIAVVSLVSVNSLGAATEDKFDVVAAGLGGEGSDGGSDGSSEVADTESGADDDSDGGDVSPGGSDDTAGGPADEAGSYDDDEDESEEAADADADSGDSDDSGDATDGQGGSGDVDEEPAEEPAAPGSSVATASTSADYYWWNSTKNGGEGAWKASVTYENDWIRHQYLTLDIVRVDDKGRETKSTVTNFYVPAGGNSTFDLWDNSLSVNRGATKGVVSVTVKVTGIRTSDEAWQTVSHASDGPSTVVTAPDTP